MPRISLLITLAAAVMLGGCLSNPTQLDPGTYSAREAQSSTVIKRGVVLAREEVMVEDKGTAGSTLLGTIIGAGLGHQFGDGDGRSWLTAGGALLGSIAGERASSFNERAWGYVVELKNGRTIQIMQQGDAIAPNTPVFVKYLAGGRALVQVDTSQDRLYDRTGETRYRD